MIDKAMRRLSVVPIAWLFFALLLAAPVHPAISETIQLQRESGTYMVPVRINETVILPFVVDSGAAEVSIPTDVFLTLLRSGTVKQSDFVGSGKYVLADGSEQSSDRFILHEVKVGDHVIRNVVANVAPVKGDPLLGQSFLSKLPAWTIDNQRHALVFNDVSAAVSPQQQRVALPPSQTAPSGAIQVPPTATVGQQISVGEMVRRGRTAVAEKNYGEAMRWYRMAADQGNAAGQNGVGVLHAEGLGVPRNYIEAMRWYRQAADKGEPNAENNIGYLYLDGLGVTRDYVEAMKWFAKAAANGQSESMKDIGRMYANGWGVPQNYTAAMLWFRKAADVGHASAQHDIGVLYMNGQGVPQDYAEAMRWYRMAAEKGVAPAKNNIGVLFRNGWGVTRDYAEAMRWFRKAADQGIGQAQANIGLMIARGEGVIKDCAVAKQWFERAAAAGAEGARLSLSNGAGGACSWSIVP
jgi:TPR repeat protein